MTKKRLNFLFLLVIFLAILLRVIKLAEIPSILNRDEAALAYNAYLIKNTGMDEWQVKHPLLFKSFGDYKLPGYPYILAFLFNFLPINDVVTKLPSVVAGVGLVIIAFYWGKNILKLKQPSSLIFALLLAVNPIFLFYSRIAFEANVALFLFVLALYLLFKEEKLIKKRYLLDFLALILIILALLTYNTPLLLLPFLIPIIIYWRSKRSWKFTLPVIAGIIIVFLFFFQQLASLMSQKSSITIFTDPTILQNYPSYRQHFSGIFATLLGNQYVYFLLIIIKNFFNSFSPAFVVYRGGSHPWHSLFNWGHLFYSSYFLAVAGIFYSIYYVIKNKNLKKRSVFLLYLLIISLAPAVVTVDAPHATRSLFFFFLLLGFTSLIFEEIYDKIKFKKLFLVIFLLILSVEASYYYHQYFFAYPKHQPQSLWPEYKDLITSAENQFPEQKITVIDPDGYQYILTAWYLKIPAREFFATMKYQGPDLINFYYGEQLTHYRFVRNRADLSEQNKIIISQEKGLEEL